MKDIKISFDFFKKNKRELYFGTIGLFLIIAFLFFVVKSINYLVLTVNQSLDVPSSQVKLTEFNVSGLEALGLIKNNLDPDIKPIEATQTVIEPTPNLVEEQELLEFDDPLNF